MQKQVDWQAVELDYRTGIKTVRQMANEYGISPGRISQKATEEGWTRDLSVRIEKAREDKLNRAALNKLLNAEIKPKEDALVEANAEMQKNVMLFHRAELGLARRAVNVLVGELVAMSHPALRKALESILEGKVAALDSPHQRLALRKAFETAMSLAGRAVTARNLANALSQVITQERLAFGIDKYTGETSYEDAVRALRDLSSSGGQS